MSAKRLNGGLLLFLGGSRLLRFFKLAASTGQEVHHWFLAWLLDLHGRNGRVLSCELVGSILTFIILECTH